MDKIKKGCYYCKHRYNIKKDKRCPDLWRDGFDPCEKFEWASTFKSFNNKKRK